MPRAPAAGRRAVARPRRRRGSGRAASRRWRPRPASLWAPAGRPALVAGAELRRLKVAHSLALAQPHRSHHQAALQAFEVRCVRPVPTERVPNQPCDRGAGGEVAHDPVGVHRFRPEAHQRRLKPQQQMAHHGRAARRTSSPAHVAACPDACDPQVGQGSLAAGFAGRVHGVHAGKEAGHFVRGASAQAFVVSSRKGYGVTKGIGECAGLAVARLHQHQLRAAVGSGGALLGAGRHFRH